MLLTVASSSAMAADAGWYAGASVGQAKPDIDTGELDAAVVSAFAAAGAPVISRSSMFDNTDTSYSLDVGYRFSPYFALNGAYVDLGKVNYLSSGTVIRPAR
jgi:hypothetical protein